MHFAAFCYVGESVTDPLKYYLNNVGRAPCTCSRRCWQRREAVRLFLDLRDLRRSRRLPMAETSRRRPINPYGQTKLDVENALKALARAHGLSFAAFRYFNAAGASEDGSIGEDHDPETHLIPLAIDAALGRRPPPAAVRHGLPHPGRHLPAGLRAR